MIFNHNVTIIRELPVDKSVGKGPFSTLRKIKILYLRSIMSSEWLVVKNQKYEEKNLNFDDIIG